MASLIDFIQGKKDLPVKPSVQLQVPPPEIDFSELWREPEDNTDGMLKILTIVNTIVLFLVLILGFFHL